MQHVERLLAKLEGVCETTSSGWRACCPCPDHGAEGKGDSNPSLSIGVGDGDKILIHCFAGCKLDAILEAMGLWYPDLSPGSEPDQAVGPVDDGQIDQATEARDPNLRHQVYSAMLEEMVLNDAHRAALKARGLEDSHIQQHGYRTLTFFDFRQRVVTKICKQFGDELLQVPGFISQRGSVAAVNMPNGIVIPVRDEGERIIALQVRRDSQSPEGKYLWFSGGEDGTSCGTPVHIPLGAKAASVVRVTEGALKADIAFAKSGLPTIGIAGVANWKPAIAQLKRWGIPTVRLAVDADSKVKRSVAIQLCDFAEALLVEGFQIELEQWPIQVGKGIDDVLAAGGITEVLTGETAIRTIHQLANITQEEPLTEERFSASQHQSACLTTEDAATDPMREKSTRTLVETVKCGSTPKLPAFPIDVFPAPAARYAQKMAASIGCPVDFVAHPMVGVSAGAIGNSRSVFLGGNWFESARMYGVIIGLPGTAKSPALNTVIRPLYRIQQALDREYELAERHYEHELEQYEAAMKAARTTARNRQHEGDTPSESHPNPVPEKPVKPVPVRIITSDATTEALAPILEQNPRGLIKHHDEMSGWVRAMDMYRGGKGTDRQFYLQVWSGQDVIVDRKAQGTRPIYVPDPFMVLLGSIQPDLLGDLADAMGRQDGFLDRPLFVFPDAAIGQPWPVERVGRKVIASWEKVLRRLFRLRMRQKDDGTWSPKVLRLTDEAIGILKSWWDDHLTHV